LHNPDPAAHNLIGAEKCVEFRFAGFFLRASWLSWKIMRPKNKRLTRIKLIKIVGLF
jgi:hypothetical protein